MTWLYKDHVENMEVYSLVGEDGCLHPWSVHSHMQHNHVEWSCQEAPFQNGPNSLTRAKYGPFPSHAQEIHPDLSPLLSWLFSPALFSGDLHHGEC